VRERRRPPLGPCVHPHGGPESPRRKAESLGFVSDTETTNLMSRKGRDGLTVLRGRLRSSGFAFSWLITIAVIPPGLDYAGAPWSYLPWPALVAILVLTVRAARCAVAVSDDGILVRKVWSTVFVKHTEIVSLVVMSSAMLKFDSCIGLETRTGRRIKIPVLSPGAFDRDDLAELRATLIHW
jgi:hypothetical protein